MRILVSVVLLVSACKFTPNKATGDDNPPADGAPLDGKEFLDAPPIVVDGCTTFSGQFNTCTVNPTMPFVGGDKIYDTDTHVLADFPSLNNPVTLGPEQQADIPGMSGTLNAILATTATVAGGKTLRVVGSKPFAIIATGTIQIDGPLDGSSDATLRGAGALDAAQCAAQTPAAAGAHIGGAAGGGGGAFQGNGGKGQDSDNNDGGATGASGGIAIAIPPGPLGGCFGGAGGKNPMGGNGGVGGRGGGAIYLVSATAIGMKGGGVITVGGAGGAGGIGVDGGAGGGGSGGMILLEAPGIDIDGKLAANGGAGGGGAGNGSGAPGEQGHGSTMAAVGGDGFQTAGGKGANGSVTTTINGPDDVLARPAGAGGGGGGGAGYIRLLGIASGASTITPAATP